MPRNTSRRVRPKENKRPGKINRDAAPRLPRGAAGLNIRGARIHRPSRDYGKIQN